MNSPSINVTSSAEPDADVWSRDYEQRWRWCWSVHVYGFGVVFLADCLLCLSSIRKTRDRQQSTIGRLLSCTLLLYSLLRSLLLLLDPYNSRSLLPCTVTQLVKTLVFPCMVLSLVLLDRTLIRLVQPTAEAHVRAISVLGSGYFGLVGAIVVVVCRRSSLPLRGHWLIVHQGLFVTCSTVLFFLVASKCLRLHRYTRRTAAARKQIVDFVRSRRQRNISITNVRRIRRLKMNDDEQYDDDWERKKVERKRKKDVDSSLDSSSDSSESLERGVATGNRQSTFRILFRRRSHEYEGEKKALMMKEEEEILETSVRTSLL